MSASSRRRARRISSGPMAWRNGPRRGTFRNSPALFRSAAALAPHGEPGHKRKGISAAKRAELARRAKHELYQFLGISAYLWVCFGALILYKAAILRSVGVDYAPMGLALVKALISAKFIMLLQVFKLGERGKGKTVPFIAILRKSVGVHDFPDRPDGDRGTARRPSAWQGEPRDPGGHGGGNIAAGAERRRADVSDHGPLFRLSGSRRQASGACPGTEAGLARAVVTRFWCAPRRCPRSRRRERRL